MVDRVEPISHNIQIDEQGEVWVDGSVRVADVVLEHVACHLSPEGIHDVHPAISLGQIFAALAYYYDHQPELDSVIGRECHELELQWAQGR